MDLSTMPFVSSELFNIYITPFFMRNTDELTPNDAQIKLKKHLKAQGV